MSKYLASVCRSVSWTAVETEILTPMASSPRANQTRVNRERGLTPCNNRFSNMSQPLGYYLSKGLGQDGASTLAISAVTGPCPRISSGVAGNPGGTSEPRLPNNAHTLHAHMHNIQGAGLSPAGFLFTVCICRCRSSSMQDDLQPPVELGLPAPRAPNRQSVPKPRHLFRVHPVVHIYL